jgi:hypothetical protein
MDLDSTPKIEEDQIEDEAVTDEVVSEQDDATAEPSTANDQDAKEPESLLDAVTAAIEADKADGSSPAEQGDQEEAEVEADDAETSEEDPPFHEHPRWKEVVSERDNYKQSHQELTQLKGFMTSANLNADEVNTGFDIMSKIKNDPVAALEALVPYVESLRQITGHTMPTDLQERLDEGYLDEDSAKELSQLRSRTSLANQASEQAAANAAQLQERGNIERHANEVSGAVSEWESKWSSSDPDYKLKQPRVMEKIELTLLKNGPPKTIEEAVQVAESCRKQVNAELSSLRPKKGEVIPITGGSSPKSTAEPKSLMEAMQQGLAATAS